MADENSAFVRVARVSDLPGEGKAIEVRVEDKSVCIANIEGNFVAVGNACAHRGAPLSAGAVDEGRIVCPWHGWSYDPVSGKSDVNPELAVPVFELKIEDEDVFLRAQP